MQGSCIGVIMHVQGVYISAIMHAHCARRCRKLFIIYFSLNPTFAACFRREERSALDAVSHDEYGDDGVRYDAGKQAQLYTDDLADEAESNPELG